MGSSDLDDKVCQTISFPCHVQTIGNCDLWSEASLVGLPNQLTVTGKKTQSTKNFSTFDEIPECEDVVGVGIIIGAGTVGQSQGRVRLMLAPPMLISSLRAII